jgi:hypothetical protein
MGYFIFKQKTPPTIAVLITTYMLTLILTITFLKIKKIKKGLSFLQETKTTSGIGKIILIISSLVIFFTLFFKSYNDYNAKVPFEVYTILLAIFISIFILIWIRREIKIYYKIKADDQTIKNLQNELQLKNKEINRITEIAKINHKINHELNVLHSKLLNENSEKNLKEINKLANEYHKNIENINNKSILTYTNIKKIDDVLSYMQGEANKNNITFNVKISGSIHYMVQKFIDIDSLTTLLSDHLKDAIIAIQNSKNTYKSILVLLGEIENYYGICIYDTGISFKLNVLLKLGLEPITTYKKTNGTGIGFMTTFDTLKKTKASLVIDEKEVSNENYTKSINIIFDNKNEYRIISYRSDKISELDINNRIITKKS